MRGASEHDHPRLAPDDLRESPAVRLGGALLERGASVTAYDPASLETGIALLTKGGPDVLVKTDSSAEAVCAGADAVVVASEWPEFGTLDWAAIAPTMAG